MKWLFFAVVLTTVSVPALAADLGLSISVGEPGFYGHLDLSTMGARPQVIHAEPVMVRPVVGVVAQPIYLYVPPGHQKKWSRHCHEYDACGRPVYFVQESWYNEVYVPRYREWHDGGERHGGMVRYVDRGRHGGDHDHHARGRGRRHREED